MGTFMTFNAENYYKEQW